MRVSLAFPNIFQNHPGVLNVSANVYLGVAVYTVINLLGTYLLMLPTFGTL